MVDRFFAGELKKIMESYLGFAVFLAHDDLALSDNWPAEILKSLDQADL